MSKTPIDDDAEDALFRVFDATQNLQRRVLRIVNRKFYTEQGLWELRTNAEGLLQDIADLEAQSAKGCVPSSE
jgi:hypothetical protein